MAKLTIATYPQKVLRRRASKVRHSPEVRNLIPLMIETMYENQGIGLAAPQIGISKRIIVVETSHEPRKTVRENAAEGRPLAFLNPVITEQSKAIETEEEGCLSLPGIFVPVKRVKTVKVACLTPEGKHVSIEASGLTARIFQHEIDHLNGKLIIHRISPLKRWRLRSQLKQIAQESK